MPALTETSDDLRLALRRLAKAVVVISLVEEGERKALVVTAVSELSLDPPSMVVCVNRLASLYPAMAKKTPFCLNILDADHEALAVRCVAEAQGEMRFGLGEWGVSDDGVPYLTDAQANMFCETRASLSHGSHDLFIAEVTGALTSGEVDPLIYTDGRYGRFAPHED
ncbi:MAG: flavin reductase family protein [Pseudomonadota bacterium]